MITGAPQLGSTTHHHNHRNHRNHHRRERAQHRSVHRPSAQHRSVHRPERHRRARRPEPPDHSNPPWHHGTHDVHADEQANHRSDDGHHSHPRPHKQPPGPRRSIEPLQHRHTHVDDGTNRRGYAGHHNQCPHSLDCRCPSQRSPEPQRTLRFQIESSDSCRCSPQTYHSHVTGRRTISRSHRPRRRAVGGATTSRNFTQPTEIANFRRVCRLRRMHRLNRLAS